MKVVKFGGSSLADGPAVAQVLKIIKSDRERRVIVVSAPGKRNEQDTKVTDLLIKYAHRVLAHRNYEAVLNTIYQRYQLIGQYFGLAEEKMKIIRDILLELAGKPYPNAQYLIAAFKAHGEYLNARLLTMILQQQRVEARFLSPHQVGLIVTGEPDNALVNPETYLNLHNIHLQKNERIIFPGFFGITPSGNIATFSRGGSDITGAILARGFHADLYENFTDVDAIFSADPRIIHNPKPIKKMTYREMRELSYAGFSVFHDEALIPAIQGQIPINVKNTKAPDKEGTWIVPEAGFKPQSVITGIAGGKNFCALYLHKYLRNQASGFTLRIMQILHKYGVTYEHMPSGIDDITIIFKKDHLNPELIDKICSEIQTAVSPDQMKWIDDYAITMVVGEGMKDKLSLCASILAPLGEKNISIQMINQGSSQISIMIGTHRQEAEEVIKTIYNKFLA